MPSQGHYYDGKGVRRDDDNNKAREEGRKEGTCTITHALRHAGRHAESGAVSSQVQHNTQEAFVENLFYSTQPCSLNS